MRPREDVSAAARTWRLMADEWRNKNSRLGIEMAERAEKVANAIDDYLTHFDEWMRWDKPL